MDLSTLPDRKILPHVLLVVSCFDMASSTACFIWEALSTSTLTLSLVAAPAKSFAETTLDIYLLSCLRALSTIILLLFGRMSTLLSLGWLVCTTVLVLIKCTFIETYSIYFVVAVSSSMFWCWSEFGIFLYGLQTYGPTYWNDVLRYRYARGTRDETETEPLLHSTMISDGSRREGKVDLDVGIVNEHNDDELSGTIDTMLNKVETNDTEQLISVPIFDRSDTLNQLRIKIWKDLDFGIDVPNDLKVEVGLSRFMTHLDISSFDPLKDAMQGSKSPIAMLTQGLIETFEVNIIRGTFLLKKCIENEKGSPEPFSIMLIALVNIIFSNELPFLFVLKIPDQFYRMLTTTLGLVPDFRLGIEYLQIFHAQQYPQASFLLTFLDRFFHLHRLTGVVFQRPIVHQSTESFKHDSTLDKISDFLYHIAVEDWTNARNILSSSLPPCYNLPRHLFHFLVEFCENGIVSDEFDMDSLRSDCWCLSPAVYQTLVWATKIQSPSLQQLVKETLKVCFRDHDDNQKLTTVIRNGSNEKDEYFIFLSNMYQGTKDDAKVMMYWRFIESKKYPRWVNELGDGHRAFSCMFFHALIHNEEVNEMNQLALNHVGELETIHDYWQWWMHLNRFNVEALFEKMKSNRSSKVGERKSRIVAKEVMLPDNHDDLVMIVRESESSDPE